MRYTVVGRGSRRDVERKGRQGRNLTKSRKEIKVNKLRIEGIRSDQEWHSKGKTSRTDRQQKDKELK